MIIQNGWIRLIHAQGGGKSPDSGYLEPPVEEIGPMIPCQWVVSRMDRLARAGTEPAESVSYVIYLDAFGKGLTRGASLLLLDRDYSQIGKFAIISEELLDAVGQIRLIV